MAKDKDDRAWWRRIFSIVILQPNFYGIGLDLKKLLRPKFDTLVVAERFLQIFEDHKIPISQIPRVIEGVTLENLRSPESLLPVLKTEILQQVADLFKIEMAWLEGHDDQMYQQHFSYKHPKEFLEQVTPVIEEDGWIYPIVAFRSSETLEGKSGKEQGVVLVLVEKCLTIDYKDIYRYIINDSFDWGYWKCRIQLKAMVRVLDQRHDISIPVYLVSEEMFRALEGGYIVPGKAISASGNINRLFLEDYALAPDEHMHSKESDELDVVKEYIEAFGLNNKGTKGTGDRSRFL